MDKIEYWLDLASEDTEVAKVLLSGGKNLYAGFMCHLAVEKALKAQIENTGTVPPKIHNLIRLAEMGGVLDLMNDEQLALIKKLNPLQLEARYPAYNQQARNLLSIESCTDLIRQSEGMIQWIKQQL